MAAHTVAAAFAPTAATVAVARPAPVAVAAAATAAAYGGYQPAHATTDYGYAQRQPEVPPPPPPVTSQNYQVKEKFNLYSLSFSRGCFIQGMSTFTPLGPEMFFKIALKVKMQLF